MLFSARETYSSEYIFIFSSRKQGKYSNLKLRMVGFVVLCRENDGKNCILSVQKNQGTKSGEAASPIDSR